MREMWVQYNEYIFLLTIELASSRMIMVLNGKLAMFKSNLSLSLR